MPHSRNRELSLSLRAGTSRSGALETYVLFTMESSLASCLHAAMAAQNRDWATRLCAINHPSLVSGSSPCARTVSRMRSGRRSAHVHGEAAIAAQTCGIIALTRSRLTRVPMSIACGRRLACIKAQRGDRGVFGLEAASSRGAPCPGHGRRQAGWSRLLPPRDSPQWRRRAPGTARHAGRPWRGGGHGAGPGHLRARRLRIPRARVPAHDL